MPAGHRHQTAAIALKWKASLLGAFVGLALVTTIQPSEAALALPGAIQKYAPLVYFHPSETLLPMRPIDFISQSELWWAHDSGCPDHGLIREGAVDPKKLAAGGYSHSSNPRTYSAPLCEHRRDLYTTADYTRPFDTLGPQGFFLDFKGNHQGSGIDVPVYYELLTQSGRTIVQYWFFYAYNDFVAPHSPNQFHEGDWERISVRLDAKNMATDVAFWNHGGYCTRTWAKVGKALGGHPMVFSALGSHASYPASGNYKIALDLKPDQTDRTGTKDSVKQWLTWNHHPADVTKQAWYGYGGGWGAVDGPGPLARHKDYSGPLGPSVYKTAGSPLTTWDKPCAAPI